MAYLPAGEETPPGTCLSELMMPRTELAPARHPDDGLGAGFSYLLMYLLYYYSN